MSEYTRRLKYGIVQVRINVFICIFLTPKEGFITCETNVNSKQYIVNYLVTSEIIIAYLDIHFGRLNWPPMLAICSCNGCVPGNRITCLVINSNNIYDMLTSKNWRYFGVIAKEELRTSFSKNNTDGRYIVIQLLIDLVYILAVATYVLRNPIMDPELYQYPSCVILREASELIVRNKMGFENVLTG